MGLTKYRQKRHFERTPEPRGHVAAKKAERQFVVQKHAASRLHYDFRLELDGVLKSWAVPKGPSNDPAVKSLAVQVEDHPLEYAGFEGIIPPGQYGGGTVMLWDNGTWTPDDDPRKALAQGRLSFSLSGHKLKGAWTLVRMAGKSGDGGKNWLLIKRHDKYSKASAAARTSDERARSVVSHRTMAQIAAAGDRTWESNGHAATRSKPAPAKKGRVSPGHARKAAKSPAEANSDPSGISGARKAKQPDIFAPQLPTLVKRVPAGERWLHEMKFDGYRLLCLIEGKTIRLLTRNGNDWTDRFPKIAAAARRLPLQQGIVDGEVVLLRPDGTSDFQSLQNALKRGRTAELQYVVFDIPHAQGFDLTGSPLIRRKEYLQRLVADGAAARPGDSVIRYSDHVVGHGAMVLNEACRHALEGVVSKRVDSHYESRRSTSWVKQKCWQRQEFVVGGYSDPQGARTGFGALLLGYYDAKGRLRYCGQVGTGFNHESLRQLTAELKRRAVDKCPFDVRPATGEARAAHWVKPELVVEVEFGQWTEDDRLRHPSFQGLREDKEPAAVGRERPKTLGKAAVRAARVSEKRSAAPRTQMKKTTAMRKPRSAATKGQSATVAGIAISHPDRAVYPDIGLTKLALAKFYESIAAWMLPGIVGRPLTVVRCPQGLAGPCFFQKHLRDTLPPPVRGVEIEERGGKRPYVVIDDLPGLITLVQFGAMEIHAWGSPANRVEQPDRLVFDLDPAEQLAWSAVIEAARRLRQLLDSVGLQSFLRTSGGKGLHLVVPLSGSAKWPAAKQFAKSIAAAMVRRWPDNYVDTASKAKRRGKIFIDYLRNDRGATAIASYSARARQGAPVATPLRWSELSARIRPDHFTVQNLPRRLESLAEDPWKELRKCRHSLPKSAALPS